MTSADCSFFDIFCRMDVHQGQAAWAQAVLSVAAVLAAYWLQNRSVRQWRRADLLRHLQGVAGAFSLARTLIDEAREDLRDPDGALERYTSRLLSEASRADFERVAAIIAAIPIHELPTADLGVAAFNLRTAVENAHSCIEVNRHRAIDRYEWRIDPLAEHAETAAVACRALEEAFAVAHRS